VDLLIEATSSSADTIRELEIVERKGIGHPDTICDALAEELSRSLARFYLDRFGAFAHFNVDKALLWGGASQPAFGGGVVTAPIEIFLAGRAAIDVKGVRVPVEELAVEAARGWLRRHVRGLDFDRHVLIHCLVRPGSADLIDLFGRSAGVPLANDTSCGIGFAPLSRLEKAVWAVAREINPAGGKPDRPEAGSDIKIMAVRRGPQASFTVACAMIDRHIQNVADYAEKIGRLRKSIENTVAQAGFPAASCTVNAGDNLDLGRLYLTVTGTSAEAGDDGQVGRGNRVNGLITLSRPMSLEAAAGKNPVSHVGKLYNVVANRIAARIVATMPGTTEAYCWLVSQIGRPIDDPAVAGVRVTWGTQRVEDADRRRILDIIHVELAAFPRLLEEIIRGEIGFF